MNKHFAIAGLILIAFSSCQKSADIANPIKTDVPTPTLTLPTSSTVEYTIKKGEQYCDKNSFQQVSISELKFTVRFDSSAIYQTIDASNQGDINKLYGFSDNNAAHHEFSARFGWRWNNNQLQIFAYNYNNGVMSFQQMGTVNIGEENNCSIKVVGKIYVFTLNQTSITMPRASTTATGSGYKLYPYFGGDEMAPHDIRIWIREL